MFPGMVSPLLLVKGVLGAILCAPYPGEPHGNFASPAAGVGSAGRTDEGHPVVGGGVSGGPSTGPVLRFQDGGACSG